jgi:hypothetical protein
LPGHPPRSRAMPTGSVLVALAAISCASGLVGSPALAGERVYWGDVHGHTSISDGKGSVDDYLTYARDVAKLDFAIVSDHDFGNAAPWWMPREAWQLTQARVDAHTVPGKFVAIAGYEWTSQAKYWTEVGPGVASERLFPGPPMQCNHKVVYFRSPVDYLFCAKDPAYMTPDLLAEAVQAAGGLIHNAHPSAEEDGRDQFSYAPEHSSVIANTEIGADTVRYEGKVYDIGMEQTVRGFLDRGGRTGFVGGTDTHEGKPAARTAVLAKALTRDAIFEALGHRRSYAVSNARVLVDFRIGGHQMGEEIAIEGRPRLTVDVRGTDTIEQVEVIRDGRVLVSRRPEARSVRLTHVDDTFPGKSYYYVRVTQTDTDRYGNPSRAWSSPIWVKARRP